MAAPTFFFLMGYAQTRTVPLHWIWLGIILTLLDGWNANWTWVAPNILLSFALVRFARPYVQILIQAHGWAAFALLVPALVAVLPIAAEGVDYGAEGWLWSLFGLYQRIYVDSRSSLLACLVAAVVYVWQEQRKYSFPQIHFAAFILGVGALSTSFCLFLRGPSRIQPPQSIASTLRFIGRHTLAIHAIQLAGSELIIKFVPDLAP